MVFATLSVRAGVTEEDALVVSSFGISKIYKSDGSAGSFNGETHSDDGLRKVFNGSFTDNIYMNTAKSYIIIDLTEVASNYVTKIVIGHRGNSQYSLYYAEDGSTWTTVVEKTTTNEAFTYAVNHVAKKVKYVFETVSSWNPSLTEIQVWGLNPADMTCLHPTEYLTEWMPVQGTETCTERGIDQCQCNNCKEYLTRPSETLFPIGHQFASQLDSAGSGLQFGSGTISCVRHDLEIVCTNGPVDLVPFGGLLTEGVYQFTDVSVSSVGNADWGVRPDLLIDNAWGYTWPYWYANSKGTSEYVQFDFGTTIDLVAVDISLPNRSQTLRFYAVEDGVEELVGEHAEEYDADVGDSPRRIYVEFRGVSLKTLRIKSNDSNNAFGIYEVHPWGTVNGAGKSAAVRTRIIID